jgi:hypothetical protein
MTLTILRPSTTDDTIGTVVVTGTGGAAGVTANSPADDATYISSAFKGSGVHLGMQDITLTATQRALRVRVRLRMFHNSADVGWVEAVDVRLRGLVTGKTTWAWGAATSSDSALEKTSGWWTVDPTGAAWSDLGIDRTQVDLSWRSRSTTPAITQLRVTEVYEEVDVRERLVVTSVTVTGFSTSTRPAWSFVVQADPDNDPQVRFRVKVFSSAVYSAAGFNPETSTKAVWDTKDASGATTAGTVGKDLVNGTTYKVYAKVAKAWSGPQGPYWWSDWTASSAFTVNTVPPIIPTLVVTQLPDLPWYRNLVEATAPVNLATADEASFDFSSVGSWTVDANAAAPTVSATNPKSGAGSMTMSSSAAGAMRMVLAGKVARPGVTYTGGASFRAAVSARSVRVLLRFKRGATLLTTITGGSVTDTTTGYTSATASGAAPAGTDNVDLVTEVLATAAAAEVHRVDEAFVHAGTTTTYSPGGLSTTQTVPVERGERVNAGRGPGTNWAHPQVWSGGTEQRGVDGFNPLSSADTIAWEPIDVSLDGPAGMIHWSVRSGSSTPLRVGDSADVNAADDYWFPVVPSATHVFSLWAWASATHSTRLNIDWLDSAGAVISTTNGTGVSFTTTPAQWSMTAAAPSTAIFARGSVSNLGSSNTNDVYLTRIGWGLGTATVDDQPPNGGPLVWNPVRDLTEFGDPVQPGEQLQLIDAEAPPGRPVVYRARTLADYSTDTIASDYSTYLPAYLAPPIRSLLKDPFQPERATIVNVAPGDDTGLSEDATELHGMGRDSDPVFIRSWTGRTRSFELSALTFGDYDRLVKLLASPRSLLWQWPEGGQEYVRVTAWTANRTRPGFWKTVTVSGALTGVPS